MSALIVIDDDLRARVVAEIREMQRTHPTRSLAGDIVEDHFDEVVDFVCEAMDVQAASGDLQIAVVIALSKAKYFDLSQFKRRKPNPNAPRIF
jgi:hypothetical protein